MSRALCSLCYNGLTVRYCGNNKTIDQKGYHTYGNNQSCYSEFWVSFSYEVCDYCGGASEYWFSHACYVFHFHCGGSYDACPFIKY